jgi:LPXTG-motif cell wall-anchored protein
MGILNKRNAVVGWLAWQVGKRVARRKAKDIVPGRTEGSRRPNKSAIASGLAALGGALWFWRKRRSRPPER